MTLLAKKDGLSTADFRNYWAGPHAALVLGMEGISKYTHNRVDKILWTTGDAPRFHVDGIVELYFRDDEAMSGAHGESKGRRHLLANEEPIEFAGDVDRRLRLVEDDAEEIGRASWRDRVL